MCCCCAENLLLLMSFHQEIFSNLIDDTRNRETNEKCQQKSSKSVSQYTSQGTQCNTGAFVIIKTATTISFSPSYPSKNFASLARMREAERRKRPRRGGNSKEESRIAGEKLP